MMDLWAVHVKNTTGSPLCLRNHSIREKSFSFGKFSVLDVRVLKRRVSSFGYHSLSVKAMAKKNGNDNSNSSSPSPSGAFYFLIHNIELLFWLQSCIPFDDIM